MRPELIKDSPKPSEKTRQQLNAVYRLLFARDVVLKSEIQTSFKLHERVVRDLIATVAKKVPVISLSSETGYKLAKTENDLEATFNARKELASRRVEMLAREKPLINFICDKSVRMDSLHDLENLNSELQLEIEYLSKFKNSICEKIKQIRQNNL